MTPPTPTIDVQRLTVEQLMRNAGHLMPPGVTLTPAERGALVDYARAAIEEVAKHFDDSPNAEMFRQDIADEIRALAAGVR